MKNLNLTRSRAMTTAILVLAAMVLLLGQFTGFHAHAQTVFSNDEWPNPLNKGEFGSPKWGGTLVTSSQQEGKSQNPLSIEFITGTEMHGVYERLIADDQNTGVLYPNLAWKWEASEDSKTFTFYIHPKAMWHDGVKVTSEDVKWTFEYIIEHKTWRYANINGDNIRAISTPDDSTVVFHLTNSSGVFLSKVGSNYGPVIVPKHLFEEDIFGPVDKNPQHDHPIGSGPLKFVEWVSGSHKAFEANDDYHWGRPYIDGMISRYIPSAAVELAALESGEVHVTGQGSFPIAEWDRISKDPNLEFRAVPWGLPMWLGFDNDVAPWNDVNVRRAMFMLVPQEEIVKRVYFGWAKLATGTYLSNSWAFNPDATQPTYDPQAALKLLDEAGIVPDANGVRLRFTIDDSINFGMREMSQFLQEHWKQFGIEVTVNSIEWGAFTDKVLIRGDFDACIAGGLHGPEPDMFSTFMETGKFRNTYNYSNPRVDELFELARQTADRGTRKEYYGEIQEQLAEDVPRFQIIEYAWPYVHLKEWRGFFEDPETKGMTWGHHTGDPLFIWWTKGHDVSPMEADETIDSVKEELSGLKNKGYDIVNALAKLDEAKEQLAGKDYTKAKDFAEEAKELATPPSPSPSPSPKPKASPKPSPSPEPESEGIPTTYIIGIVLVIVAAVAVLYMRKQNQ